jgi:putative transposase
MKSYQKKESKVKESIAILDQEKLLDTAAGGLLNLSIELGFEVMRQMLELDVEALAGKKGKHDANRTAYRHGSEPTKVVLGGEKRSVDKPRVRSLSGVELPLPSLTQFQNEDSLSQAVLAKLLRGVSTRKYAGTTDYPSPDSACTSKSEVSRRFIAGLEPLVAEFLGRKLEDDYPVIMIDGMNIGQMTVLAAMGIKHDGTKQMLGVIEGGSENHLVANALLADLAGRGLAADTPRLFVLDGGKALHKAVTDAFGKYAAIQRCQVHKKRNVLSHLPKSEQTNVGLAISRAYLEFDYENAKKELSLIATNLEHRYPKAASSLLEGLEETLTVHQLEVPALLRQTLCTTNPMESANSVCMGIVRRIKNWKNGEMILRNIAAGFMEAEKSFRRIKGYRQIPILTSSLFSFLKLDGEQNTTQSA